MLTNRGYLGETSFREITVPNAHDAIIDQNVFDLAQRILAQRGETIGRRAANPSDYDLTGLIVCPQCGRKYIGTNATGRNRTYRYYTCFSRQRYGTKAVYRVPMPGGPHEPAPDRPKPAMSGANDAVHALVSTVDRRLQHKNTVAVTIGPDLRLPIARERPVSRT